MQGASEESTKPSKVSAASQVTKISQCFSLYTWYYINSRHFVPRSMHWDLKSRKNTWKHWASHTEPRLGLTSADLTALTSDVHREGVGGAVERGTGHPPALHNTALRKEGQKASQRQALNTPAAERAPISPPNLTRERDECEEHPLHSRTTNKTSL